MRYAIEVTDGVDMLTGSSPLPDGAIQPVQNWEAMIVVPWFFRKVVDGQVVKKTEAEKEQYLEDNPPAIEELQQAAQLHLDNTDWYIIRLNDPSGGQSIPQEILDSRQAARAIL